MCEFLNNNAAFDGGAVHANSQGLLICNCNFTNNTVRRWGGALYASGTRASINASEFNNNTASRGGGIFANRISRITVTECSFSHNHASQGGVIYTSDKTILQVVDVRVHLNIAVSGVMYLTDSTGMFSGNTTFSDNLGSLFARNSNINITSLTVFINNVSPNFSTTTLTLEGGAITAVQSDVHFNGGCLLVQNSASKGGAVFAVESKLYVRGETTISNNIASDTGGGLYLEQTELNCQDQSVLKLLKNTAAEKGGGIHAISSTIKVDYLTEGLVNSDYVGSSVYFIENCARKGGGVFLEASSKLYILKKTSGSPSIQFLTLIFTENMADYGGAVYVADDTNSGMCVSIPYSVHSTSTECFLQSLSLHSEPDYKLTSDTNITNNVANFYGSSLFGGLLDRCTVSPFAKRHTAIDSGISGKDYITQISNIQINSVSSDPVRVCFCIHNEPNCSYQPSVRKVKKGEKFTVSLVAVDQVNNIVSNATIHSSLSSNFGGLGENQINQATSDVCTDLSFEVFSPHATEELIIHANGPCKDAEPSRVRLKLQFSACRCPVGFQSKVTENTRCVCDCDYAQLEKYITKCDPQSETVLRKGTFWISYVNETENSPSGYLIYPHCPLNYCYPSNKEIRINLNMLNGADVQCANNRHGLLCGSCNDGFSLSLGSSHCLSCPRHWPVVFVVIIVVALVAGIALVAIILILNMTVAVGTLNGIIFYANVVAANSSTFFPYSRSSFITVFISWFNLDFGFDTCFFKETDAYWKIWVQLMFPTYVIFLVILMILISGRSKTFSELIGKKNPVATLATLILLSYAKFLHVIIATLSSAELKYPGQSSEGKLVVVWLPDATVKYLRG